MIRITFWATIWLIVAALFTGCFGDKAIDNTPRAYGRIDNILVVCDDYLWKTAVGDSFRTYFEALYPVTPQPEPLYDIRHVKPTELTPVMRTHRTVIFLADLEAKDDEATRTVTQAIGKENFQRAQTDSLYRLATHLNRWALGQVVVYWFAPNKIELAKSFGTHHQRAFEQIQKNDNQTLTKEVYSRGKNDTIGAMLERDFALQLQVPQEYYVAQKDSAGVWLRRETNKVSSNLFIYELPANTEITPKNLKVVRDTLTRKYFSSRVEGSYMQIDDRFLPVISQPFLLNGIPSLQSRGIWSMVNDFMGGAFVTYLVKDEERNRVLLFDGFVHAPGQKKRPEMRALDLIFATLKLGKSGGN